VRDSIKEAIMWELVKYTIAVLSSSAITVVVVGWLARTFIKHRFLIEIESHKGRIAKDLELFRAKLQADTEKSITGTRHQLELLASEHNIRFGKLHEKRANVIEELYSKLDDAIGAVKRFLALFDRAGVPKEELGRTAMQKWIDFTKYYQKHKIYFNDGLCEKIDIISKKLLAPILRFEIALDVKKTGSSRESVGINEGLPRSKDGFSQA
jgi:hypothetical protein